METGIVISLILFFVGLTIGLPIGWAFLGSVFTGLAIFGDSAKFTAATFYQSLNTEILCAIGFFILAGNLLSVSGLAKRIVSFSYLLVRKLKGGLIVVTVIATVFMGALTGSSIPCLSAIGPIMVPELERYGYLRKYTTAIVCSSSFLGYLIPPSVPALIYCLVAQQSVAALFLSTIFPGLILAAGYIILNSFIVDKYMTGTVSAEMSTFEAELIKAGTAKTFWSALPALGCPATILVGMYGGFFTASEAGAIAVFYTLFVGKFIYKELSKKNLFSTVETTAKTLGMYTILIAGGTVLSRYFMRYGVAQEFATMAFTLFQSKVLILLSINIFLLILGMFLDGIPILLLAVPLLLPIAKELNVNLVHLGAMIIVNVGIGVITPPFAVSIFFGSKICNVASTDIIPIMMKFLFLVAIPVLLLTTFIPALSCWLPTVMLGESVVGVY